MTSKLFDEYCTKVNMKNGDRHRATAHKAVLLIDNASSHTLPPLAKDWAYKDLRGFEMSHTIFIFLPKNVTSHAQPLDQGIISAAKARFRARQVRWYVSEIQADPPRPKAKVDLRLAIMWISDSFRE
eukprot:2292283-Pyramimonas_sp.AAC.1